MSNEEIFDSLAKKYDEWYKTPLGSFVDSLEFSLIKKHCGNILGKRILDVGCGTGSYSIRFANLGAHVTGIDSSEEMLEISKHKTKDSILPIHFHQAEAESLPFDNDSFDLVISVNSFEFVNNQTSCFKESYRVLKKGGKAIFCVLNEESLWINTLKNQPGFTNSVYKDAKFFTPLLLKQYLSILDSFSKPSVESCVFLNYNPALFLEPDAQLIETIRHFTRPLKGAFLIGSARK
ncbi:MAG: class I SAM-dependent methyltransferase [Caldisericia bacterium]|nr:class I SAM-dependent methyltransferase [Caldisericia bacterium]